MSVRRTQGFTAIDLLAVIVVVGVLVAFLVPLLGKQPKRSASIMKESVYHHHLFEAAESYASSNKDWFPGLTSNGRYSTADFAGKYYFAKTTVTDANSGANATTDSLNNYAMAVLLEEGGCKPADMISPGETNIDSSGAIGEGVPGTGSTDVGIVEAKPSVTGNAGAGAIHGEVTRFNLSHALLQYGNAMLKGEWRSNQNQQAVITGTRVIFTEEGAVAATAGKFNTIWTDSGSGIYKGYLMRGDGSTDTVRFTAADVSTQVGVLKYNLPTTPLSSVITFTPAAHDTTAVGVFGKSGQDLRNFDADGTKGQIGSAND